MSYPKRTLKFRPTRGYAGDTPACELGAEFWGGSIRNILFRKGFALRIGGSRAAYGTWPAEILHLQNARIDTTNYWIAFHANTITARETSNSTDITPSGGLNTIDNPWQYRAAILNGVPIFTNGLDPPHYWDGNTSNDYVELPGWPAGSTCKSIATFKYHIFALDIDESAGHFQDKVMWSDAAEPGTVPATWTPGPDNEAGSAELSDTRGPTQCAHALRGSLLIYKRAAMYAADYIEGQTYVFRTLFTNSGALTRHSVCDVNGQHFVVTDGDIILTDGTNRTSVGQARMREYLFSQLDSTNYENLFVGFHRAKNEAYVCFPES